MKYIYFKIYIFLKRQENKYTGCSKPSMFPVTVASQNEGSCFQSQLGGLALQSMEAPRPARYSGYSPGTLLQSQSNRRLPWPPPKALLWFNRNFIPRGAGVQPVADPRHAGHINLANQHPPL